MSKSRVRLAIDKIELLQAITCCPEQSANQRIAQLLNCFLEAPEFLLALPARLGHWIAPDMLDGRIHAECSCCHKIRVMDDFCSACGAQMSDKDEVN